MHQRTHSFALDTSRLDGVLEQPLFRAVAAEAKAQGIPAFAIGGYVRDLILGRPCKDIDFVVEGDGIAFAEAVAKRLKAEPVHVFKNFGTAMFMLGDLQVEFVGARKESYARHSRKPEVEPGTIKDDQERRDFTINALAISLNEGSAGALVDPFGGILDLDRGILRTPLDPDITYSDDPLRMMRAVRFATQLGFIIDPPSFEAIKRNAERLDIISAEHRGMWRLSTAMDGLRVQLQARPAPEDAAVLGSFWALPEEGRMVSMLAGWKSTKDTDDKQMPCTQRWVLGQGRSAAQARPRQPAAFSAVMVMGSSPPVIPGSSSSPLRSGVQPTAAARKTQAAAAVKIAGVASIG